MRASEASAKPTADELQRSASPTADEPQRSASPTKHLRQESDARGNTHMMGKQCVQEHGSRTQGKSLVKVLSSGLRRDASSASSLMFYA